MFTTEIDRVTEAEWNVLLEQFSDATIYQTWAYGAISWGDSQLSHFVLKWEGKPVALAQLRVVQIPLVRRGVAYLRWGPVCTRVGTTWDAAIFRQALQAIREEYVRNRRLHLQILPRCFREDTQGAQSQGLLSELGFSPDGIVEPYHSFRVDLRPAPDELRKKLDQKWRNQLNGAERNNLEIVEGTGDHLYQEFLELYAEMMNRKRFHTTVDVNKFRDIQKRLPNQQKMWIVLSRRDGRPMTALVGDKVGDMGIYLLGATSDEGMKTKGSYLQQWRMMLHLKDRGCRYYDLGGINPQTNPGVFHFKQGMGGEEVYGLGRFSRCDDLMSFVAVNGIERFRSCTKRIVR
jgi:hypothetical protein